MKNTTLISPVDMLCPFPCKGCGAIESVICECCKNNIIDDYVNYCPNCKRILDYSAKCKHCNLPMTYVVGWRDELIGTLVHDLKYNSTRQIGKTIAEILDEILPVFDEKLHIVPLPTIKKHVRERGLDHTLLIAKKLAKRRGWKVDKILGRNRNTVQVGSDERTRKKQASKAYRVIGEIDRQATYLLLDDVWTTGASMKAAIRELKKAGATKIVVVVLAISRIK